MTWYFFRSLERRPTREEASQLSLTLSRQARRGVMADRRHIHALFVHNTCKRLRTCSRTTPHTYSILTVGFEFSYMVSPGKPSVRPSTPLIASLMRLTACRHATALRTFVTQSSIARPKSDAAARLCGPTSVAQPRSHGTMNARGLRRTTRRYAAHAVDSARSGGSSTRKPSHALVACAFGLIFRVDEDTTSVFALHEDRWEAESGLDCRKDDYPPCQQAR